MNLHFILTDTYLTITPCLLIYTIPILILILKYPYSSFERFDSYNRDINITKKDKIIFLCKVCFFLFIALMFEFFIYITYTELLIKTQEENKVINPFCEQYRTSLSSSSLYPFLQYFEMC